MALFNHELVEEPKLEFGAGGRDIDVRFGLMRHGPVEPERAREVRIGVIGTAETNEGFAAWVNECRQGVAARESRQQNLFVAFPGLEAGNPFRCDFSIDDGASRTLPKRDIQKITQIAKSDDAVLAAVELFTKEVVAIAEGSVRPDVIVCALPADLIQKIVNDSASDRAKPRRGRGLAASGLRNIDFRDFLKAKTLAYGIPLQLVWPTTWSSDLKISRALKKQSHRTVQDKATRAWNFFTALYYKAGYVPWRIPRDPTKYVTSFVGISFYNDPHANRILTSTAQMFDERGQGLIIRGGRAQTNKSDRRVYLDRNDAFQLLQRSLDAYRAQHRQYPARVVVHKTSRFEPSEMEGFNAALEEAKIELGDFVWVSPSSPLRLFRPGGYPVLRGTCVTFDNEAVFYTRGSIPFYQTYPGLFIPTPIAIRCTQAESTPIELAQEILALTKMNWNTSQFDGHLPITLRAAKEVSNVLRYVPSSVRDVPQYAFYI